MKKIFVIISFIVTCYILAQDIKSLKKLKPHQIIENIVVEEITTDKNSTTFVIWIKEGVKLHKHEHHTENIYVLEGKGLIKLGETERFIKPGDFFTIPENMAHGVTVTSNKPMKVISTQSPQFLGLDRIMLE